MSGLSGIKAISFDVDGTLWDFESAMRTALEEVLSELAQVDPCTARKLDVERMKALRDEVHERLRGRVNDLDAIREESIKQALCEAGRPDEELGSYLAQVYFQRRDAARTLFSDVRPALERLAARYRLGLLSNGNSRADALGIGDLISFEVFSQDHNGVEKPALHIFEIAFHEAGCEPSELLHVGDSLESNVAGAKAAGVEGHLAQPQLGYAEWGYGAGLRNTVTVGAGRGNMPVTSDVPWNGALC